MATGEGARTGTLKVRALPIDSVRENVAFLARDCHALRPERYGGSRKVEVAFNGRSLLASVLISDSPELVGPGEIGLAAPALRRLGVAKGQTVVVAPARSPKSFDGVRAKVRGETLDDGAIGAIVRDIAGYRYSDIEIAAFLMASASLLSRAEVLALTKAMADAGSVLRWDRESIVDKHCIGGIPGNRTTMIVVPIVAAHGLIMPKTSSRAITSPAGTADTMEVLACVDLSVEATRAVVEKCGACIVWGGHMNLSPADDILVSVERPLGIDTPGQMVASILSKKLAAGSTHLVIDMPVGPTAKIRSAAHAAEIRSMFEYVGEHVGLTIDVVVTDGAAPVGCGVGPVLETRDVLRVLDRDGAAPRDLREKAIDLAGRLIEFDQAVPRGAGSARARDLLDTGAARARLDMMIEAQGAAPRTAVLGTLVAEIPAPCDGVVRSVDCFRIATLARMAGAPTDPGAGLDLLARVGARVRKGEPLFRVHGEEAADFAAAVDAADDDCGFVLQ